MKHSKLRILIFVIVALILASCSLNSTVKVGFVQSSSSNGAEANYFTFNGKERYSIRAKQGDELRIMFDFEVDRGTLTVQLVSPNGDVLWTSPGFLQSGSASVSSQALETGR